MLKVLTKKQENDILSFVVFAGIPVSHIISDKEV